MAGSFADVFSPDNPVFRAYVFYCAILVLKLMFMSIYTARTRMKKMVFSNPEDIMGRKDSKIRFDDPDVERVRRAHQNDLENLVPFFVAAPLYQLTAPSAAVAVNLFRAFAAARCAHTLVYAVWPRPQPARSLCFGAGFCVTLYMAVQAAVGFL
ncbi:microsomal glutathione S-transferase 1-like [Bacillus rossius redtenbacheri]|uniref:microsomal glutathione S-transferase 1-like n=1 Tax=Bacillus rossius redtenbacheri TaxID=93214 RepID=UPI002FDEA72E